MRVQVDITEVFSSMPYYQPTPAQVDLMYDHLSTGLIKKYGNDNISNMNAIDADLRAGAFRACVGVIVLVTHMVTQGTYIKLLADLADGSFDAYEDDDIDTTAPSAWLAYCVIEPRLTTKAKHLILSHNYW